MADKHQRKTNRPTGVSKKQIHKMATAARISAGITRSAKKKAAKNAR